MIETYCCRYLYYIFPVEFLFFIIPSFHKFLCIMEIEDALIGLIAVRLDWFPLSFLLQYNHCVMMLKRLCNYNASWSIKFIIFSESVLGFMIPCLIFHCLIMLNNTAFCQVFFLMERIFDNC